MNLMGDHTPADFSEDIDDDDDDASENPRYAAINKHKLLEWVTEADFSKDI